MFRRLLGFAALLIAAGCGSVTDADSHLTLAMTSDRATLNVGDTAHFVLTLTNHSSSSIRIAAPSCPHFFTVNDAADRPSGPPQTACLAIGLAPRDLAPGQSITLHDSWAADSGQEFSRRTFRVGAGTYTIRGVLAGADHPVTSNPIGVVVRGAP